VLWAAIGKMFTAFVVYSTRLTIVYAGFAFIVAALLWTYFGWLILLAGAQLSFYVQNPAYLRLGLQQLRLSSVELEELALKLMYFVGRSHVAGGPRWTVNRLADELGLPGIAVAQMVTALERCGLLIVSDNDELVPARDISRISVYQILDVARNQRSGHIAPRNHPLPSVDRVLAAEEEARRSCCEDLTLRGLIEEAPRPALHLTSRQSSLR
jgi:membrane protein